MATDNQENNGNATPLSLSERGATRRRLAKAGVGAAGVLLTLESRAGMSPMICKAPSGALSGGLSSNYNASTTTCAGLSPGYWKNHSSWPVSRNIMFNSVFEVAGDKTKCTVNNANQGYLCTTMLNLLSRQTYDRYNLGMHLVATYLNVMSGKISFLSVQTLQKMWSDLQSKGSYSPAPGVNWSAEQVKNYLQGTHD